MDNNIRKLIIDNYIENGGETYSIDEIHKFMDVIDKFHSIGVKKEITLEIIYELLENPKMMEDGEIEKMLKNKLTKEEYKKIYS